MDEKQYLDQVKRQVAALADSVSVVLGSAHPAVVRLRQTANSLSGQEPHIPDLDEEVRAIAPEGFPGGQEAFDMFMDTQTIVTGVDTSTMVGVVDDGDRTVEVGDVRLMSEKARELVQEVRLDLDLDEDEPVHDRVIRISYRRLNGEELTEVQVNQILDHPYSSSLRHLGALQKLEIEQTDVPSVKKAVFAVLTDGDMPLDALALGLATYRGTQVFPGIGAVEAIADVTNLVD